MGQCNHLILYCMDYRIQPTISDWIKTNGYLGDIDIISLGGACLQQQTVLDHVAIGCEKHAVKKVFLSQHEDCAAYGGSSSFASIQDEKEKLISDMSSLKNEIEKRYPGVQVEMLWVAKTDSDWKVTSL